MITSRKTTFLKASKSDDQTSIEKNRVAANITEILLLKLIVQIPHRNILITDAYQIERRDFLVRIIVLLRFLHYT